ncbi:MAG: MFS transporter [Chlamydiales bacterium]|nr:MFS transporter [Chlamydiales bacterium]
MSPLKIAILLSYICVATLSAAMITPALPHLQAVFSLGPGEVEWIVTVFLFGYVFGQLIYGPLANRFGRLTSMRFGLVINLIGCFLCLTSYYTNSYSLLLFGRLVTALGAACGLTCTFILLYELLGQERAKHALAFAVVSFSLGVGLGVSIGGIVAEYWNWGGIFWVLLLHGALALWGTWLYDEPLQEKQSLHIVHLIRGYVHVLKNPLFIIFSLVLAASAIVNYTYSASAPLIAHGRLNLSPSEYGYWNLINIIGMLGSGFGARWLLKKYKPIAVIVYSIAFLALCIGSLFLQYLFDSKSASWFFITTMVAYFFSGLLFPCGTHYALSSVNDKGSGSSMMSFINMGTACLSVLIMGYLPFLHLTNLVVILILFLGGVSAALFSVRRRLGKLSH